MKAVIHDVITSEETPIPENSVAVFGEGFKQIKIFIRKRGDGEILEINGYDTVEIIPNATNSFYVRVRER